MTTVSRRTLVVGGAVGAVAATGGYVALGDRDMAAYDDVAAELRAPLGPGDDRRELIRYATLAANSHNTQPWRFRIGDAGIDILPDFARRTPVVDPDDHHLYVSLGCAAENLAIAAAARGLHATPAFDPAGEGTVSLRFALGEPVETSAFAAIPHRQCSRSTYDGQPVPANQLTALEAAAASDAVDALVLTDRAEVERILALTVEANTAQFSDAAFVAELKHWLRFNPGQALATRDGLFSGASGNPAVPAWLGRFIFGFVSTPASEGDKVAAQVRSSAGLIVLVGRGDDPAHWVECGRSYQRFALAATALGIRHAFVNQTVEVPAVREKLAAELGIPGRRPDMVLRFGTGPAMPPSLRRPVEAVLVA